MKSLAIFLAALAIAAGAQAAADRSVTLQVSNMTCATCPIAVRLALEKVPGVSAAKVEFKSKVAAVTFGTVKCPPMQEGAGRCCAA